MEAKEAEEKEADDYFERKSTLAKNEGGGSDDEAAEVEREWKFRMSETNQGNVIVASDTTAQRVVAGFVM